MALSRPTGVPFAAMAGILFLYRLWEAWQGTGRRADPGRHHGKTHSPRELWALAALTTASGISALLWPAIAWATTGDIAAMPHSAVVLRAR